MCPAIHINSRSWLRSSSTREPSDPPLRVFLSEFRQRPAATSGARGFGTIKPRIGGYETVIGKKKGGRGGRSTPLASWRLGTGGSLNLAKRGMLSSGRTPEPGTPTKTHKSCSSPRAGRDGPAQKGLVPSLQRNVCTVMILPQVHLRKPCYDFYFL